ncbi:MAG: ABC transporter ATP-binding protein [Alphaproteobacteria bacterium]|nr:ABC transporter ATP-binding protein [Alphaproteobacteria bacterium]
MLQFAKVSHKFEQAGVEIPILNEASLSIKKGEAVALVGPSGSGKSTLLNLAGLLERPLHGTIMINGRDVSHLSEAKRTNLRLKTVGFVFQSHNLLQDFTALENVMLPQLMAGKTKQSAQIQSEKLLMKMGLEDRMTHKPFELSGGEQQRVAIARALSNEPDLLLADEPTGNLDPETSEKIFRELISLVKEKKLTTLIATHDLNLARRLDYTVRLRAGKLI